MKKPLLIFLICICSTIIYSQDKRGIAYGYHSPEDLEVLSPTVSWWYNWSEKPESTVADVYSGYGFEFVPMTWNGNFDSTKLVTFLSNHPETKYLLAFNEPNFIGQANMTPSQAAAIWPIIESIADDYNLEIVGPAVNFCDICVAENGVTYDNPFDYLDAFFSACQNCRVDHIAVHSYMNNVFALQWYLNEFKMYNKSIWLTEFAGWESNGNINNLNDQINFMIGAVDLLESDTAVFRYSWFIGRGDGISNYPFIDLLGANGELTELGQVYTQMPIHDEHQIIEIPNRIEAEDYTKMSGVLLEKTADESGFANVGYIDSGDWLEYKISVPGDHTYPIRFRIAATSNATLNVLVDGESILTQNFNNTGGWQNWSTFVNSIDLTEGEHVIRLQAATAGFNINWFQIGDTSTDVTILNAEIEDFKVFPNPLNNVLNVKVKDPQNYTVSIIDITGKTIIHIPLPPSGKIDTSSLKQGVYLVIVDNGEFKMTRKIIK